MALFLKQSEGISLAAALGLFITDSRKRGVCLVGEII